VERARPALFASPLVTYLEETWTARTAGQSFPIARQAHLCATLSNRLGITDICGLDVNTSAVNRVVQTVTSSWPSDAYSRGNQAPALASSPSLLMRGGMESLCAALARQMVTTGSVGMFPSNDATTAIERLVTQVMGLTSDRATVPRAVLQDHFAAALQTGAPRRCAAVDFVLLHLTIRCSGGPKRLYGTNTRHR
jgi:hypothetical protein